MFKKIKPVYIKTLGISLIILTWIIWGVIFLLPFFKLTVREYAIAYPVLLIATNLFWIGTFLVGKEIARKYNIFRKIKTWLSKIRKKNNNSGKETG
jgi:hypothetical protein